MECGIFPCIVNLIKNEIMIPYNDELIAII